MTRCVEGQMKAMTNGQTVNAIANVIHTLTIDDPSFIIHDPSYAGVQSTAKEITADAASQRGARVISSADIIRFCVKINDTKHSKAGGTAWKSGPVTIVEKSHKTPPDFAALPEKTVYKIDPATGSRTGEMLILFEEK